MKSQWEAEQTASLCEETLRSIYNLVTTEIWLYTVILSPYHHHPHHHGSAQRCTVGCSPVDRMFWSLCRSLSTSSVRWIICMNEFLFTRHVSHVQHHIHSDFISCIKPILVLGARFKTHYIMITVSDIAPLPWAHHGLPHKPPTDTQAAIKHYIIQLLYSVRRAVLGFGALRGPVDEDTHCT